MGERSSSVISGRGARSFTSAAGLEKPRKCSPFLPPPAGCPYPRPARSRRHQSARALARPPSLTLRGGVRLRAARPFSRVLSRPAGLSLQPRPEYRVRSCGGASHGECLVVAGRPAGPVRPAAHGEPMCALGLAGQRSTQCPASSHGSAEARPARPFPHHGFSARTCAAGVWGGGQKPGCTRASPPAPAGLSWMCPVLEKKYVQAQKLTPLPGYLNLKEKKKKQMFDLGIDQG